MTGSLGYWKALNLMNTLGYTFKEVSYVFEWKLDGTICACFVVQCSSKVKEFRILKHSNLIFKTVIPINIFHDHGRIDY